MAELAGAVRPFSRRSAQIEANRAKLIAEWIAEHGGAAPASEVLTQIDRRAWAMSRPNKPANLDEQSWEATVRDELAAIDPALLTARAPVRIAATRPRRTGPGLLADAAVVDADERSTRSGGRFSSFDLRAGAMRALSRSGVIAPRDELTATIDAIAERAHRKSVRLVEDAAFPGHVKAFMATETVRLKMRLAGRLDALASPGRSLLPDELRQAAASPEDMSTAGCLAARRCGCDRGDGRARRDHRAGRRGKDHDAARRVRGAGATTATDAGGRADPEGGVRRVTRGRCRGVEPARSARRPRLPLEHRRGRRQGVDAAVVRRGGSERRGSSTTGRRSSCSGAAIGSSWTRPAWSTCRPRPRSSISRSNSGSGVAMVGDPYQALPVGHAGAMASAVRFATASVELDTVHRFSDPEYAALTLRLRNPRDRDDALEVAGELLERGHVQRVGARRKRATRWLRPTSSGTRAGSGWRSSPAPTRRRTRSTTRSSSAASTTASSIPPMLALGMGEQRILVGDTVQTRRNDPRTGVENRAQWVVRGIRDDVIDLASVSDSGEMRRRQPRLRARASAAGVRVDGARHPGRDDGCCGGGAGCRRGRAVRRTDAGRHQNVAITVARTDEEAIAQVGATMMRGTTELTIQDAMRAADAELRRAARERELQASAPWTTPSSSASRGGLSL